VASVKTNLADYPVTMAMKDGRVASSLVTLEYCGPKTAHDGFKPMLRENAFDAGELAIVTYLQAKAWGKPFVLLPIPISGRFQHHCIGFNHELGPLNPKEIEGRKVGVRTYAQTTGLWVRGILQHEYGVDLDKVTWLTIDESHLSEHHDPPNCQRLRPRQAGRMMLSGEIAAAILGNDMPKDPRVRTLVPDAMAAARQWYQREGVIPINHMFAVRQDLSRNGPTSFGISSGCSLKAATWRLTPQRLPSRRLVSTRTGRAWRWRSTGRTSRRSFRAVFRSTSCSTTQRPPSRSDRVSIGGSSRGGRLVWPAGFEGAVRMRAKELVVPVIAALLWVLPVAAIAQGTSSATITGVVHDQSGGVLPGVTVEASSPDLIEGPAAR